jgi:hypothetical protein
MSANHRSGAAPGPVLGVLLGLALAVIGLVFLVQGIRAADLGYPLAAFGIPVENALPGVIVIVLGMGLALWSIRAMHTVGSRAPRTQVAAWHVQPPPDVKAFGDPPAMPSHRAQLAAAGLEAVRLAGDQWHVRPLARR